MQGGRPLLHTIARSEAAQKLEPDTLKCLMVAVIEADPSACLHYRDSLQQTALHTAIKARHFETCSALVDEATWGREEVMALVKAPDARGNTALHLAAEVDGHPPTERVLLLPLRPFFLPFFQPHFPPI
jgi:hypothetical protein